jgi:large subunit ribosomal protein L5
MSTLREKYSKEVVPRLQEELGLTNRLRVPRLTKVVLNMGLGIKDKDVIKRLVEELAVISGQRPVLTRSRKSISNFKLREGMVIGAKVTLRGARMYDFMERLVNAALPRIRDFRGLSPRGVDSHGNYTLGIKEQSIFPEVDPNDVKEVQGMDITIVTTARDRGEALALLRAMGMPFAEN